MAKNSQSAATSTEKPEKKGKKLALRSPIIKHAVGLRVQGTITLHSERKGGKFGDQKMVTLLLLEPCTWTTKDGEVKTMQAGESVILPVKPGMAAVADLEVGTDVDIECTGTVDVGKGNAAYTFEVFTN